MRRYRVVEFGQPKAPWRTTRQKALQDAVELGLGSYDEWGQFYITIPAEIEAGDAPREGDASK
jgi:hypothetical protein